MAAFLSIFTKLPLTPRMNEHIAARKWWWKLILKAFSQQCWSRYRTREAMAMRDFMQL
jgi:hypothetical protein